MFDTNPVSITVYSKSGLGTIETNCEMSRVVDEKYDAFDLVFLTGPP